MVLAQRGFNRELARLTRANCPDMDISGRSTLSRPHARYMALGRLGVLFSTDGGRTWQVTSTTPVGEASGIGTVVSWTQRTAGPLIFPSDSGGQPEGPFGRRLTALLSRDDENPGDRVWLKAHGCVGRVK